MGNELGLRLQELANACSLPAALENDSVWGLMTQLYTVRSERSWGIGDAADLARVLEDVVLDPPLRERMRQAGRARAARFDWHVVGQEVMGVYDEVEGR